nr:peptide synthase [Desulfobacterales bacterium]
MKDRDLSHPNIAACLPFMAEKKPYQKAVIFPHGRDRQGRVAYTHLTFKQLDEESDWLAHGIKKTGLSPGDRAIVLLSPSLEFVTLTFALMKTGTVPVLIDPGMGIYRMVSCIKQVQPRAFFGIPKAHLVRILFPKYFRTISVKVTVGRRWSWGGVTMQALRLKKSGTFPIFNPGDKDIAAIFFTTGSTGPPKGVVYTHPMLKALVHTVKSFYQIDENDLDLPTFPLFVLFSTAFGITAVIPDMDPTKPAEVNPAKIVEAINNHGVTNTFGSPAIWNRVGRYCEKHDIKLPSVRRILIAGAPVPGDILERFRNILPSGNTYTPYGATEALLLTSITGNEICKKTLPLTRQGRGTCVGRPLPGVEMRIISITDDHIELSGRSLDSFSVPPGEVGEILVRGGYITREYFAEPEETTRAKIIDGETFWHRTGDLGYFDEEGRLWFVGRKAHRVERCGRLLFPVMVEAIFNQLEGVARSALVGIPSPDTGQKAVMVIEPSDGKIPHGSKKKEWEERLMAVANDHGIPIDAVLFHPSFPVDIRHNVKIRREELAKWAQKKLKIS